nr:hypothetical protein TetV2_00085 [Oceanusvirus sp.]
MMRTLLQQSKAPKEDPRIPTLKSIIQMQTLEIQELKEIIEKERNGSSPNEPKLRAEINRLKEENDKLKRQNNEAARFETKTKDLGRQIAALQDTIRLRNAEIAKIEPLKEQIKELTDQVASLEHFALERVHLNELLDKDQTEIDTLRQELVTTRVNAEKMSCDASSDYQALEKELEKALSERRMYGRLQETVIREQEILDQTRSRLHENMLVYQNQQATIDKQKRAIKNKNDIISKLKRERDALVRARSDLIVCLAIRDRQLKTDQQRVEDYVLTVVERALQKRDSDET